MLRISRAGSAPDGLPFQQFCLTNGRGMKIRLTDWGATWISCKVPTEKGLQEVLLSCALQDYPKQGAFLGATVGRYANRIANGRFRLNGKTVNLTKNQGKHQLHGGNGFDKVRWQVEKCGDNFVCFSHFSPHGDQGFEGNVQAKVTYRLTEENGVEITFEAQTDQDTPLNLTNHAYFNLVDAETGADVRQHHLQLNADYFLPVDREGIPSSPLKAVADTAFDFTKAKAIARDFLQQEQCLTKGYDHSFLLRRGEEKPCAILTALDSPIRLEMFTTQPALQVYTGNYLAGTPNAKGGRYADYAGIALEAQSLPDTPNHPEWYRFGGITQAGKPYFHRTVYRFA
ncbi:galactose-1-epimerase [Caviibacterium pharyngocola]|uniref:Aldose 1-epimerase n=1 Tax=Caviibacterium pharyngocola TaxID=28159 RepID=A0A2M8RXB3_9PAST|nr:galactose-1-epimerase [Caviibacterium pharyngocola]PJG83517.1 galactose-1-epimerase [Caviibacterium pharyngocola]